MTRQIPITFCPEMVKAVYEGRKRMTRRIEGLKILNDEPEIWQFIGKMPDGSYGFETGHGIGFDNHFIKPRYHVGDECWIKETWATEQKYDNVPPRQIPPYAEIWFPDELGWEHDKHNRGKVRTSRYICKWMARRWLRITKVHDPERVNTISEEDCIAEGIIPNERESYTDGFHNLWDSLHPKPAERFEHGPWVFPYEFEMIEGMPQRTR